MIENNQLRQLTNDQRKMMADIFKITTVKRNFMEKADISMHQIYDPM